MNKFLVLTETMDTDYQEVIEVSHPTKDTADFQEDWDTAAAAAVTPQDTLKYDNAVEAMHAELRKLGWVVTELPSQGTYVIPDLPE